MDEARAAGSPLSVRIALGLAMLEVALGAAILIGWLAGIDALTTVQPGYVATKPNVALSFILLGAAVIVGLAPIRLPENGRRLLRNVLATVVVAIAVATLIEYALGSNLGIDQAIAVEKAGVGTPFPGRPPAAVALALGASGVGLLLLGRKWRVYYPSQALAFLAGSIGGLVLLGYAYNAQGLVSLGSVNRVSLLAAPGLLLASVAIIAANREHGLVRQLGDPGVAGQVSRRVLPAALLVVPIGALLRLEGERAGIYDSGMGLAIVVVFEAIVLLAVGAWAASRVLAIESERAEARRDQELFFELSSDLVMVTDWSGRCVQLGAAWERVLGRPGKDMLGRPFLGFVHPDDREMTQDVFERDVLNGPGLDGFQNRYVCEDGEERWLEWSSRANVKARRVFAIARDVTERRKADEVRREASLYARALLEASLDPLVAISSDGKITDVNRATEAATGLTRERLVGTEFASYFTEPEIARESYRRVLETGELRDYALTIRHVSGTTMDVLCNASLFHNGAGERQGIFAAARDVRELRRAEEVLREQAGLLDLAHDAILVRDFDGLIRYWNAGAERTYGWSSDEAIGGISHDFLGTVFPESAEALDRALIASGSWEGQLKHTAKDGRKLVVQSRQVVERDDSGKAIGVLEINRDVTESANAVAQLAESAEELRRSNEELEQFAYVASHDLQEPLRMVTGFVGLLQRRYAEKLDSEADEYIGFAVEGAHRMQSLINDLLAYSRVGTRGREHELVPLGEIVEEALTNLRAALEESRAEVRVGELPTVLADRRQMVQLFQNLLGNALKFRGKAKTVVRLDAERDGNEWRVQVRDNGIGIALQHQEQIFVIFGRLHSREAYPGSGIGLAICKKIVERHGGRIGVESRPGHGSTFWVTLPDPSRSGETVGIKG